MTSPSPRFDLYFNGSLDNVRTALAICRSQMARFQTRPRVLSDMETVLAEVLNNIVEHAHSGCADRRIHISADRLGQDWHFSVSDQGNPMPGGKLPDGTMPEIPECRDDLPEGGFGWALVHRLSIDLSYERKAHKNRVDFTIPETRPNDLAADS